MAEMGFCGLKAPDGPDQLTEIQDVFPQQLEAWGVFVQGSGTVGGNHLGDCCSYFKDGQLWFYGAWGLRILSGNRAWLIDGAWEVGIRIFGHLLCFQANSL